MSDRWTTFAQAISRRLPLPEFGPLHERALAGVLTGALYLTGAVSALGILMLPGESLSHSRVVLVVAALGAAWGAACLWVVPWTSAPAYLTHVSSTAGFGVAAVVVASTGGSHSPARFYLFFIIVFAAYFYSPRIALAYCLGCGLVHALPLLYEPAAVDAGFLRELLVVVPTYAVLGAAIVAGKQLLVRLREHAETAELYHRRLADEQGAMRRVATAVAARREPHEIYQLVSEESGRLLGADGSGLLRFETLERAVVVGAWAGAEGGIYESGTKVPIRPGSDLADLVKTGRPQRVDEHQPGSPVDQLGYKCSIVAPVRVGDRTWGALAIVTIAPGGLPADTEARVSDFCELLATAIANTEDRARLATQAVSDALTGLVNHRVFHEQLRTEVGRAQRHDQPLALALVDVDHFKEANDSVGHEVGDRILAEVAELLRSVARTEDVVARIGGDEFALLLPATDRLQALNAVERLRRLVAAEPIQGRPLTLSAGICDLDHASDAETLFRLADGALYWSKAHGRDSSWIYDPEVVHELSAQERADHLQRSQALTGLRALARAIDARDPTTHRHSERVALLCASLAELAGWSAEGIAQLRDAALIHDVGKIGVPDAILLKPGALTIEEYEQVKQHAALSAQIAEEVLGPEQVEWIRAHHERPDGRGYPAGLIEYEIPEGAALLALADSWDVMTISRPYSVPKGVQAALEECRDLVGRQFTATAVRALLALHDRGSLTRLTNAGAPTRSSTGDL
ncbi:MAG TPA: diguanylate cyclase [Solirubrobacteraceae bacterium]|nr:diguanylate cyclase [Solirubrobacteraceae bacterium]